MNNEASSLIVPLVTLGLIIVIVFSIIGVILCNNNNAIGVVLLTIGLPVIGLIIGLALLYNAREKIKQKEKEEKMMLKKLNNNVEME